MYNKSIRPVEYYNNVLHVRLHMVRGDHMRRVYAVVVFTSHTHYVSDFLSHGVRSTTVRGYRVNRHRRM
jgi:hypothetical protein